MAESAWASFNRSRPPRLTKLARMEGEVNRLRAEIRSFDQRTERFRQIEARAKDVLDLLDESGSELADYPSPMRLRHAIYGRPADSAEKDAG